MPGTPLYPTKPPQVGGTKLTAVPYFSWANRGQSDMTVWIRDTVPDLAAPPTDDDYGRPEPGDGRLGTEVLGAGAY
jgi:hypothetical protein